MSPRIQGGKTLPVTGFIEHSSKFGAEVLCSGDFAIVNSKQECALLSTKDQSREELSYLFDHFQIRDTSAFAGQARLSSIIVPRFMGDLLGSPWCSGSRMGPCQFLAIMRLNGVKLLNLYCTR
jgi:hypothetical protein